MFYKLLKLERTKKRLSQMELAKIWGKRTIKKTAQNIIFSDNTAKN